MLFGPAGQEIEIFPMFFNNSYLRRISLILHRSARCTIPMVSRTRRFASTKNALYFIRCFNNFVFRYYVDVKNRALIGGFGHIFKVPSILHQHHAPQASLQFTLFQF